MHYFFFLTSKFLSGSRVYYTQMFVPRFRNHNLHNDHTYSCHGHVLKKDITLKELCDQLVNQWLRCRLVIWFNRWHHSIPIRIGRRGFLVIERFSLNLKRVFAVGKAKWRVRNAGEQPTKISEKVPVCWGAPGVGNKRDIFGSS